MSELIFACVLSLYHLLNGCTPYTLGQFIMSLLYLYTTVYDKESRMWFTGREIKEYFRSEGTGFNGRMTDDYTLPQVTCDIKNKLNPWKKSRAIQFPQPSVSLMFITSALAA